MPCNFIADAGAWFGDTLANWDWSHNGWAAATTFGLVAAAEFGDKSQLVCMSLAARHAHWPVLWGAGLAFALLNGLAVSFGAAVRAWLPPELLTAMVAVLFLAFGLRAWWIAAETDDDPVAERPGHGVWVTAFLMIFLAEFGDKTQIAVAALGAAEPALAVWCGATLGLVLISALGVWAGRTLLQRVSARIVHRLSGGLFLGVGAFAAYEALLLGFGGWGGVIAALRSLGH